MASKHAPCSRNRHVFVLSLKDTKPSLRLSTDSDCSQLSVDRNTWKKKPKHEITLPLLHPSENKDQLSGGYANVFIRSEGRNNEMLPSPQRKFDATWCFNRNIRGGVFVSCLSAVCVRFLNENPQDFFFVYFNHDDNRIFNLPSAFFPGKTRKKLNCANLGMNSILQQLYVEALEDGKIYSSVHKTCESWLVYTTWAQHKSFTFRHFQTEIQAHMAPVLLLATDAAHLREMPREQHGRCFAMLSQFQKGFLFDLWLWIMGIVPSDLW